MKRMTVFVIAVSSVMAASLPAFAAEGDFVKIDTDKNGQVTMAEGKVMHPDWTDAAFKTLDTDANGTLSQQEYDTAMMKKTQ